MNIVIFILVGIFSGFLAGKIWKGKGFGMIGNLVVGLIGAFIGGHIFEFLGIFGYGLIYTIITSVIGALVLLWLINLFTKK